ncbi:protein crossbronx homolog [Euwallacea similis]|uniref:protein crossbronx homolog n=1 Tax=Euwallacea similis TaxID=1736056 RepID=UPI00344CFB35
MFSPSQVKKEPKIESSSLTRQGSLRKVLPPPEIDRDNLFGRQNEDLNKIYKSYRQEYVILAEYKMIQTEDIQGIYVIPSRENPLVWFGVIFARNGPYKDGVFRFNILLDENFPDSEHPKVIFQSQLIHPVINPETRELNLQGAFPTWHKNEHLWQVLKYIQWVFLNVESSTSHAVNKEARDLLLNNKEVFTAQVQQFIQQNKEHLHETPPTEDKHYILFDQFNPDLHKKERMLAFMQQTEGKGKNGYSWVLPGLYKPLERPETPPLDNGIKECT